MFGEIALTLVIAAPYPTPAVKPIDNAAAKDVGPTRLTKYAVAVAVAVAQDMHPANGPI